MRATNLPPKAVCWLLVIKASFAKEEVQRELFSILVEQVLVAGPFDKIPVRTSFGGRRFGVAAGPWLGNSGG